MSQPKKVCSSVAYQNATALQGIWWLEDNSKFSTGKEFMFAHFPAHAKNIFDAVKHKNNINY
jgi:hypothetical protein